MAGEMADWVVRDAIEGREVWEGCCEVRDCGCDCDCDCA